MAFCGRCGNELREGANFCPKCGTPVGSTIVAVDLAAFLIFTLAGVFVK